MFWSSAGTRATFVVAKLGHFPAMLTATNPGVLSQNRSFSNLNHVAFLPKTNQL